MKNFFFSITFCVAFGVYTFWPQIQQHYTAWDAERHERWHAEAVAQVNHLQAKGFSNVMAAQFGDQWVAERSGRFYKITFEDGTLGIVSIKELR